MINHNASKLSKHFLNFLYEEILVYIMYYIYHSGVKNKETIFIV